MSANENNLPPNVIGRLRAYLDVVIESIHWKTSKTYCDVKINVLWWGQSGGVLCEGIKIDINKRKSQLDPLKILRYQVKTNLTLFESYLSNCEPIRIDVYSSKTGDFIGSSQLQIPLKFHHIEGAGELYCKTTTEISSGRQFCLGELVACMRIQPMEVMTQKISTSNAIEKSRMKIVKRSQSGSRALKVASDKDANKENIQVTGNKKKISFREPKPTKPSTLPMKNLKPVKKVKAMEEPPRSDPPSTATGSTPQSNKVSSESSDIQGPSNFSIKSNKKSSLINFLSGEPMSHVDENKILHELVAVSPTPSVINSLKKSPMKSEKQKLSNKIDSIRIVVSQVEFNAAGQLETQNFMNKSRTQKCVMKCAVTSKIFKSNQDVKMISPVFETAPQRIPFGKEIIQRLTASSDRNKFNVFVNFGFCVKSIELQTSLFFLGFARVRLLEVVNNRGIFHKKCPIINESDIQIGTMTVKLELGINELHFGRDLQDLLSNHRENISVDSDDSILQPVKLTNQKVKTKSHPSHSNDDCEADRNYDNKKVQTDKAVRGSQRDANVGAGNEDKDTEMVDVGSNKCSMKSKVYRGLLFIEGLRNVKENSSAEYFITYEGFWNDCQESTETSADLLLNYLKLFPVICDDAFVKRVQNNQLELKLWEKTERSEKWIGSTRVPLHQFFIAFRDAAMIEHLSTNPLPIISIDNWSNFVSPLSSDLFCQGKVLLAIGNENQIEYLKLLRNLHNLQLPVKRISAGIQVDQPRENNSPDPNAQMKDKLSAFIASLSQKLPEPSIINNNFNKIPSPPSSQSSLPQLRKTSELLDSLQKALSLPPTPVAPQPIIHQSNDSDSSLSSTLQERIKMRVSIEHASHLPKTVVKKKANRRKNKNSTTPQKTESEPSVYATFESALDLINPAQLPENVVKSHEGFVYCTKVLQSCDPQWNQNFDVELPLDILTNSQKKFIVKIWRKISSNSDIKAAPFEDAVVGFSAVDLSVLLTGLAVLSGYYNIVDFSGRCHGQIKLSFKPAENLTEFQDSSASLPTVTFLNPLNIEVDDGANLLSRTLKRKFTELDEITQRLKARLFDVTGDENFDPDEEFEKDLNTAVDDMDEDQDFDWLKSDTNGNVFSETVDDFQSQMNKILECQPSTSKQSIPGSASTVPTQRQVSGCSNTQSMAIDQLLKKYDLDTLINPSIFKNILDPALANSDSTPTLNPQQLNTDGVANVSGDSGDTTVSSILSNDQVQAIQKALKKTSLAEGSDLSSQRKDPDGENNISE